MGFVKRYPTLCWGVCLTLLFLWLGYSRMELFDSLELKLCDMRMGLRGDSKGASDIILVNIDDESIERLGRWPWPRSIVAEGVRKIGAGSPKAIGLNIIFSEATQDAGLMEIKALEELFEKSVGIEATQSGPGFRQAMVEAQTRLDHDRKLSDALRKSGAVILPVYFKGIGQPATQETKQWEIASEHSLVAVRVPAGATAIPASEIVTPLAEFVNASKGLGHINLVPDMDGKARRELLLIEHGGLIVPSYTLRLAAQFLGVPEENIQVDLGSRIRLGGIEIPTTPYSEYLPSFKGPRGSFKGYPFYDVLNDKVPLSVFNGKLVLVSSTAAGMMNPLSTPTSASMPLGEYSANIIWSILNRRSIHQPSWNRMGELVLIALMGLILTLLLPRLKALWATAVFVLLMGGMLGTSTYLFASKGLWVSVAYPVTLLLVGYIGVVSIKYFTTEVSKEKVEGESAETNRMLGLSFQGQGMLDMAFDKFRRVPVDDGMKDILYNLALDFERKRQFNKAVAVYEYIEHYDHQFKDIPDRKRKLIQASDTVVLGAGMSTDGMLATATDTRPTLGRYEIIKQLGKGAMGVVYLGQDPRINRITAIKTLRFGEDFDTDEAKRLKEKFFIEAESAGTLSHPNIVTIYDAGEEQDLAYIAMEFLEGEDLQKYTKEENLLPMRKVIQYCADIAEALDYAHNKGIVHRDIKPANIMLLKSGIVKITDFGIARIAASSQTQTGVVKGTPFYMSPEQISGQKVDGRSDIFSLGVMMYQLLTGRTPFTGENLASLMHMIMNIPHPDPRTYNKRIFKALVDVIDRSLAKDKEKRYQKASQLASHLRQLGKSIDDAIARKMHQAASA